MTPAALSSAILDATREVFDDRELDASSLPTTVAVERPRNRDHGDYATNIALQVAKRAGVVPRELAGWIADRLAKVTGVAAVDVAGPGFLNITLDAAAQGALARTIVDAGADYGNNEALAGQHINVEFVSANPTGPIHIGGVRWAAVGDALARLFQASGAQVTREYYFNDHGTQIDRFVSSLIAAAKNEPAPADGYAGQYIGEIAGEVLRREPDALSAEDPREVFRQIGVDLMFDEVKTTLRDFGVVFDVYFHEDSMHESGAVERAIAALRKQGHVYDADGAVWLRTTDFGDDKDRVLLKSDGNPAYFAGDAAYYLDKRSRGFDVCLYLLGADHAGYVGRLKALAACAGDDPNHNIEVLIGQLVNLVKDGEPVRMSKRAGNVVTLVDLVDAVGVDAARYALARASVNMSIDLDMDLWTRSTSDNPIYYVQYAHSRIASVLRNAKELGIDRTQFDPALLDHEREGDLLGALGEFPRVVAGAAELREPHRIPHYLEALAGTYHRFYDSCRILPMGDEEPNDLHRARLWLCEATRIVLANGLGLLGVSAPERM